MNEEPIPSSSPSGDAPLPNRITRGTLTGCAGILCVLAMPALLFLPVETWHLPRWIVLLLPLIAFALAAIGALVLAGTPSSAGVPAGDPRHPLTRAGKPPILERPAGWRNRGIGALASILISGGVLGYLDASFSPDARHGIAEGAALTAICGALLLLLGIAVAFGELPPPAWQWVRTPIGPGLEQKALPLVVSGLALLCWALLTAAFTNMTWGDVGLALLVLSFVLLLPFLRRLPPRSAHHRGHDAGLRVDGTAQGRTRDDE